MWIKLDFYPIEADNPKNFLLTNKVFKFAQSKVIGAGKFFEATSRPLTKPPFSFLFIRLYVGIYQYKVTITLLK